MSLVIQYSLLKDNPGQAEVEKVPSTLVDDEVNIGHCGFEMPRRRTAQHVSKLRTTCHCYLSLYIRAAALSAFEKSYTTMVSCDVSSQQQRRSVMTAAGTNLC